MRALLVALVACAVVLCSAAGVAQVRAAQAAHMATLARL